MTDETPNIAKQVGFERVTPEMCDFSGPDLRSAILASGIAPEEWAARYGYSASTVHVAMSTPRRIPLVMAQDILNTLAERLPELERLSRIDLTRDRPLRYRMFTSIAAEAAGLFTRQRDAATLSCVLAADYDSLLQAYRAVLNQRDAAREELARLHTRAERLAATLEQTPPTIEVPK